MIENGFLKWFRRRNAILTIEKTFPSDSKITSIAYKGADFIDKVGGDINIDWRDLPLDKIQKYANLCESE